MNTPNNLPAELTSFVGREPQLAELRRLLHRSRLITLTGPGGAGKTRLALRLAAETLERYPDGVWLLELATIGDSRLLEQSVAAVCGANEVTNRPSRDAIVAVLGSRQTLLLLDGCEHLVDSCADLTMALLRACPHLRVLATSREPLGVQGEIIWRTPSLTIPNVEHAGTPELLMESESIRLFVDRARLSRPGFEIRSDNAVALAQICARLEGIPLAIELAAGLAGVMSTQEILDRLGHRFRLLTGGSRSSLPRHQTLRQAVDWSYTLLSPAEQALFARLGVFAGGFELEAAEAVVTDEQIHTDDVLPLLTRLVDKSLVVAEQSRRQVTRYRMLDTIREYALEKLQVTGEAEWRRKHAAHFTGWSIAAVDGLSSANQLEYLQRLADEQPNVRLSLEWNMTEQPDEALRQAGALGWFWWMSRSFEQGVDWLDRTLQVPTQRRDLRAVALVDRARFSRRQGDYMSALKYADEGAAIARELGLHELLTRVLSIIGIATRATGNYKKSMAAFKEALRVAERIGDRDRIVASLNNIAFVESAMGDHAAAAARIERAMKLVNGSRDRFLTSIVLDTVGRIHFRLRDFEGARRSWMESLRISAEYEDSVNVADCLEGLGLLAANADGEPHRALVLLSAAEGLRAITGVVRAIEEAAEATDAKARASAKIGRTQSDSAVARGTAMNTRQAVAFALREAASANGRSTPLTEREMQVALLIADGMTNGEVGGRLRISERTVDAHVEHIRNKLGLRTRAQIAVWAHERLGTA